MLRSTKSDLDTDRSKSVPSLGTIKSFTCRIIRSLYVEDRTVPLFDLVVCLRVPRETQQWSNSRLEPNVHGCVDRTPSHDNSLALPPVLLCAGAFYLASRQLGS